MAVLAALSEHAQPMGLRDILARLPQPVAERTVRRWLDQLVREGRAIKSGATKGTRYRVLTAEAHELPGQTAADSAGTYRVAATTDPIEPVSEQTSPFSPTSSATVAYTRQPLFKRKPVSYNADWVAGYRPNQTSYFNPTDRARLAERGRRSVADEPAGTYARRIYARLLVDLSYNSSRLEGNTYSLLETERLLVEGAGADGKLDEETAMVLNHKEAIRHLVDQAAHLQASFDEVLTLHYLLSDALVAPPLAGSIRDHGVRVGGSTYVPLENRDRLASALMDVTAKAAAIDDPFEQSLFLLVHIAYLQAFADVNKRTSRLCANIPLLRNNMVPLSFKSITRDDYASAMVAVYELNDVGPIADLYLASYFRTCEEYDATVEAVGFDEIRVRYRQQRRRAVTHIITNLLIGEAVSAYLAEVATASVPGDDQARFLATVREDLVQISPHRLAGLGVTRQQLGRWLALEA